MKVGFIGVGKMGYAMAKSIAGGNPKLKLLVSDRKKKNLQKLRRKFKARICPNLEIAKKSDLIVIAVKPQDMHTVLKEISAALTKKKIIVTPAASLGVSFYKKLTNAKIIRIMPNLAVEFNASVAPCCFSKNCTKRDVKLFRKIFDSTGFLVEVKERDMDSATVLGSSSPAFFSMFAEQMMHAASKKGISKNLSSMLLKQSLYGTGKIFVESKIDFSELVKRCASPKGVTVAGLKVMKKAKSKKLMQQVFNSALARAKELGKHG